MFGKDLIIGLQTGKIDSHNRIFIPTFAYPEGGDKIVIELHKDDEYYLKLFLYEEYLSIAERYINLRKNAQTKDEYEKLTQTIEDICGNLAYNLKLDAQKRLHLPTSLSTEVDWHPGDILQYKGLGTSLKITKK